MEQRSTEWFAARIGKVTASKIADVDARTKSGWGASRATYMGQLIAEKLSGEPYQSFTSTAMQWGIDTEDEAKRAYEFFADVEVTDIGFVDHPEVAQSGASPDGLVGDLGLVEIKCPNTATHIDTLLSQKIPSKYVKQMYWQMACTKRDWCDFVSFDPRLPAHMSLYVQRLHRDSTEIDRLEGVVSDFIEELNTKLAKLESLYRSKAA